LYAKGIWQISGFRLTVATLAGSRSNVGLILEQLNTKYIDYCSATTHVQNLSTPIPGFHPEIQRKMVMKTLEAISYHVYPYCATDTLLEASLDDENLIFVSNQPLKSDVQVTILDIIYRCYRDGHQLSPLLTIPNQYDNDFFFKSRLEGLINRWMVDIVRVANEKRKSCEEEYTEIDMTVHSLAVWRPAWGESEALQPRWMQQTCPTRRSLCPAWGESETLQQRRMQQTSRKRRSLCSAWGESIETQTRLNPSI
jgi:hypothetical protein